MSTHIQDVYNPEIFRKEGHKLIDTLADYMHSQLSGNSEPAIFWKEPEEMYLYWKEIFSESNTDFQSIVKNTLDFSVHLHNPRYIGHQVSAPIPHVILSELVSALINNSTALYEMGMSALAFERIIIEWVCKIFGYPSSSGGILTSGGSLGNLTAILAARQKMADFDVWEDGMNKDANLTLFVSEEAHYSLARAGKILGFGKNIIKIPANHICQMDLNSLNICYQKSLKQNKKPIAVIASACTTSTGSYDDLNRIADFCERNKLWLHIDGAHGAGAILSEKYKYLVEGINRADSIVIDFHKMLLCPSLVTAVIFKENNNSYNTFKQKASYLWESDNENDWFSGGKRTIECTKKMMGLKIFVALKLFKEELFSDFIESRYNLARELAELIKQQEDFDLAIEPQSNIVCFRFKQPKLSAAQLNEVNSKIRKSLLEAGRFYIVQTIIRETFYFRVTIMNPFTTISDFQDLLNGIRIIYKQYGNNL